STYAFAAVLSSFIVGLALGALMGAALADRSRRPAIVLAAALLATTLAAYAGIAQVAELEPAVTTAAEATLASLALPSIVLAFRLTLPIAVGLGVAFPLSLEVAGSRGPGPARRLGLLYAGNTAASVAGALIAGFVAIPVVGLRTSLLMASFCLLAGAGIAVVWGA